MASGRTQKRARKKEARDARREAIQQYMRRRRRQRLILLASSLALIGAGVLIVLLVQDRGKAKPSASPTSNPSEAMAAPKPQPVACGAELPAAAGSKKLSYGRAEDQTLDPDKTTLLRLETSCGDIEISLDVKESPAVANSVAYLARQRFYDGLVFHRIVPGFVIQGGDPRGDGSGGAGYDVVEPPPKGTKYTEGVVAMAKAGNDPPGSASSQFFIVSGPEAEDLPAEYAVVGKVVKGMDVVRKIEKLGREGQDTPSAWAYIERASVLEE